MRRGVLVIAAVAGVVYANDPAPVAFDAGEWYGFSFSFLSANINIKFTKRLSSRV